MGWKEGSMARRPLLADEERQLLFGVPDDPDALARHYTNMNGRPGIALLGRGFPIAA
jgi:hypothetical protein